MLIDTHAHLEMLGDGAAQAVERAKSAGVGKIVSVSTKYETALRTVEIAQKFDSVYAGVGIHPHSASTFQSGTIKTFSEMASNKKVVAIGETGLDYHYIKSPREIQIESFEAHVEMAGRLELPFVVHVRDSEDDVAEILKNANCGDKPGVIHCFSGTYETAKRFLDMDFFISFSGILTFKNAPEVREAAKKIPSDRILIETDSPYLAPVPMRGKDNEPAFVKHVFETLAEVRETPREEMRQLLFRNTLELFPRLN
ncbi:MAG: YchF/TatD family DNA exonuclease [Candidatus Mycalebacterium zealandia]|nr:MAG: YchF/TatD family DNA exonuclease [Candidatus Mycalebacterium zealandia]